MADYKFTQQSGDNWKVNTSDKADAMEDTNEIRAIVDELGRLLVHSKKDGFFPEDLTSCGTLQIPASLVEVSEISTATYDDVQDWLNNTQSGGRISGGTISDDGDGTITVSSGTGFIQTTTGDIGLTQSFDWSADSSTGVDLTDNSANYIYVGYNAGTPKLQVTTARGDIHLGDHFTLGRVYRSGTDLHILQSGMNVYNAARRNHERLVAVRNFERASGGVISESAVTERAIESTIGNFYLGANKITTEAQDTSTGDTDTFTYWYYDGANWQSSTGQTQISKTQYNDTSTGLKALTSNRYGVHWAYIHFDSDIHVVYGQDDYKLAEAENAVAPDTLPSFVEDFGILAAKIILQQGSTGFNSIVTAYKVLFPVTNPAEHNDLGALDTEDYQHLTQVEHDEITGDEQAIDTTTGTASIDWGDGRNALFTRSTGSAGAVTFSFTAPTVSANLSLIIQGSTAGSTGAVTWPTVYWEGGSVPSLSSGVSAIDKIEFYYSTGLVGYLGESLTNYSTV